MELTSGLRERLDKLVAEHDDYGCTDSSSISEKRVIPLLGPSAVGKSTLIASILHQAREMGIDAAEAGTSSTRKERLGDPANYHTGIPMAEMIEKIEDGKPVNWSLYKTGEIYATMPEDFPADYNFMALMPDSLPMLQKAGFKAVHAFYIATDPEAWEKQLEIRMYTSETLHLPKEQRSVRPDFAGRLDEAMTSLPYALANINYDFIGIASLPGTQEVQETASRIIDACTKTAYIDVWGREQKEAYNEDCFEDYCRGMFRVAFDLAREIEDAA